MFIVADRGRGIPADEPQLPEKAAQAQRLIGKEYIVADARAFRTEERFDLVMAAYLFNYGSDTLSAAPEPGDVLGEKLDVASHLLV